MSFCSPKSNVSLKKNNLKTCFSNKSLRKIANAWNKHNPKKKINMSKKNLSNRYLLNNIKTRLSKKYNNEWCLLKKKFVKELNDSEINDSFRPEKPKEWLSNSREWLSTVDIEKVLSQYEEKYKDYINFGPVPIDFDKKNIKGECSIDDLCKLKLKDLIKNKFNKFSIVFNLDKHDEPGSHWVALFGDLQKKHIYYFDSYGIEPPVEVDIFMKRFQEEGKKLNMDIKLDYNNIRHQYKNSECGMYSIHFIIKLVEGNKFKDVIENIIFDDEINQMRDIFYRPRCNVN